MTFNQVNAQFVTKNASNLIDTKFLCALRPSCEAVPAKMLRWSLSEVEMRGPRAA